jgi:hypothetical protein
MVVAKWVVRDGQHFSTVKAAYNDACERRLPDRALFGKATHRTVNASGYIFGDSTVKLLER